MEFVLGGIAATGAGFFTNPLDVIKTRLQLQGELQARGLYTVHYRGFFHAFYAVAKNDGILALQKGLVPALWYQFVMNGARLGGYDLAEKQGWLMNRKGDTSMIKSTIAGAFTGCLSAHIASPFYLVMEFVLGGVAAICAGIFTNPLDVVKTRLQLQGELKARGLYAVKYKGFFHAFYTVAKADGILALQKGLVPALWYQLFLNGMRFGTYDFAEKRKLTSDKNGNISTTRCFIVGLMAGVSGAFTGSPFYLVKTHLQSQSAESVAVGYQHKHTGTASALWNIYTEHGIVGLWRGVGSAMPRAGVGSASQLVSFSLCKEYLDQYEVFAGRPLLNTFASSVFGGIVITTLMTPFDVVMTRLYNQGTDAQGKGLLYRGVVDCLIKMWKTEGIRGYYKGFIPNYIRLGPHTILCFVFWDALRGLQKKFTDNSSLNTSITEL